MEEDNTTVRNQAKPRQINTVFIVDDDADWCFISTMILQKAQVGKKIVTAGNGQEALETLQTISANGEKLPELVFLDIKMPVMDGFEFLDEISKLSYPDLNAMKIYICSSSFHPRDKEKAHQYPIAGFITKPLTPEILQDILLKSFVINA